MNPYSILSFIAFLLYLQAGVIVFFKTPRRTVNIIFSLLCLAFAIYAFFSIFIFNAVTIEQVYLLDRFAAIGWTTFPVLMVMFFAKISDNKSLLIKHIINYVLFPLVFITIVVVFFDVESNKLYYQHNQNWFFELNKNSVWVYLFVFYLFLSVGLSIVVLVNWYLSTQTIREKKQAGIIILAFLVFFVISTFTNLILPFANIELVPALAPVNSMLWIAGAYYALDRYQRDVLSTDIISNLIINSINEFVLYFDNSKTVFAVNNFTLKNLLYTWNEIIGLTINDIICDKTFTEVFFQQIHKSSVLPLIKSEFINSKGEKKPVLLSGLPIKDKHNNQYGYVLIGIDNRQKELLEKEITERIRAEERLNLVKSELEDLVHKNTRELFDANKKLQIEILERKRVEDQIKHDLDEKISLVSEVHHRVKNNIQIIISLIKMLSGHKDINRNDSEKIAQIAERVRVISSIHDDFYSSEKLSDIDFAAFVRKKTEELNSSLLNNKKKKISYKFNLLQKNLEIDKAIPCGIIYHEVLSNAIKFAFPEKEEIQTGDSKEQDRIQVNFYKEGNEYVLTISDNGIGIPEEAIVIKKRSVGLKMVDFLIKEHLKGKIEISNSSGTSITIKFS